jgi:hypothetical protein
LEILETWWWSVVTIRIPPTTLTRRMQSFSFSFDIASSDSSPLKKGIRASQKSKNFPRNGAHHIPEFFMPAY